MPALLHALTASHSHDPSCAARLLVHMTAKGRLITYHVLQVAKFLGTIHHEFTFTVQEGLDALEDLIWHIESFEQVYCNHITYPTLLSSDCYSVQLFEPSAVAVMSNALTIMQSVLIVRVCS